MSPKLNMLPDLDKDKSSEHRDNINELFQRLNEMPNPNQITSFINQV